MRNILLGGASALAFFVAAPALAQSNTSTVTQSGADVGATVNQVGSGATSTVTQGGADNNASVSQAGASAESVVVQDNGTGSGGNASDDDNSATIDQTGDVFSRVRQFNDGATAEVTQNGDGSSSDVTQTGDNDDAFVNQQGDDRIR